MIEQPYFGPKAQRNCCSTRRGCSGTRRDCYYMLSEQPHRAVLQLSQVLVVLQPLRAYASVPGFALLNIQGRQYVY